MSKIKCIEAKIYRDRFGDSSNGGLSRTNDGDVRGVLCALVGFAVCGGRSERRLSRRPARQGGVGCRRVLIGY